jgi:hypothetical protein
MGQHVAGERPNLSTAGPPKPRPPKPSPRPAGRPRRSGDSASQRPTLAVRARAADSCRRYQGGSPAVALVELRQLRRPYARTAPSASDQELRRRPAGLLTEAMTQSGPGDPNRSLEPDGVRASSRSPGSSGGRDRFEPAATPAPTAAQLSSRGIQRVMKAPLAPTGPSASREPLSLSRSSTRTYGTSRALRPRPVSPSSSR